MKYICTLTLIMLVGLQHITAQQYAIGNQTITFTDASRSGRQIPTNVFYPADHSGANVAIAAGSDSFPVVVFGHGFVIPSSAYNWLADSLVPKGYIVAFPTTGEELFPSHTDFANDLFFLCNYIPSLNDSTSSFLYHRIIKKSAVAGHSMGGGCSFLAAAQSSNTLKAIFNFAAAETNPSAITAALSVTRPALIFSGSSDCIAPASSQQQMYANVNDTCKAYVNITGAVHCQFAGNNATCVLGQTLSGCNSSSVTQSIVFSKATSLLLPFLDYYLKGVCQRSNDYINTYDTLSGVTKMISCKNVSNCGVLAVTLQNFNAVPAGKQVNLSWKINDQPDLNYFEIEKSSDGYSYQPVKKISAVFSNSVSNSYTVTDEHPFPGNSFYRLKTYNADGAFTLSAVVKVSMPAQQFAIINVLPNPVKDNLQIQMTTESSQKIIVSIYDMNGERKLMQTLNLNNGTNVKTIAISALVKGMYILSINSGGGTVSDHIKIEKQ